jgi:hypothetical protein
MELADRATSVATRHTLPRLEARAHYVRAVSLRQQGRYDEAATEIGVAHRTATDVESVSLAALCEMEACRIHRLARDSRTSLRWARRARNTLRSHGERPRAMAELETHLTSLERYPLARGRELLGAALQRARLSSTDVRGAEVRFHLATLAARAGDFEAARREIDAARPAVEIGAFDRAMAVAIDDAADAVAAAGQIEMAEELWELGREQWWHLGTRTISPE